ncbi:MAG: ATP-binding protein, partial [Actinobacteria bacterium]|nr:ATP-binding protein [Actinomycetota bacterium]
MGAEAPQTDRLARRLAWPLLLAFLAMAVTGMVLQHLNGPVPIEDYGVAVGFASVGVFGAFMASRRPGNPVGWLFLGAASLAALGLLGSEYAIYALVTRSGELPGGAAAGWIANLAWLPSLGGLVTFLLLVFPNGRLPSRRWRPVAWAAGVTMVVVELAIALAPGPMDIETRTPAANPFGIEALEPATSALSTVGFPALSLLAILSAASLIVRYRRAGSDERHQIRWFLLAGALLAVGISTEQLLPDAVSSVTFTVALVSLPAAAAVAVFKYRLYDIDVVLNKTVVFGALAAFFSAVYVGIVVGVGTLVGSRGNVFLSVAATAVIAVAFHPVREWARRLANRLVYGERATPYQVLAEFGSRMAGTHSTEDVLPRMARILAEGTGAARAEVWLRIGSELVRETVSPSSAADGPSLLSVREGTTEIPGADVTYEVRHQGELLGALAVTKPLDEPLSPTEDHLVRDMASQAGLVLRNVRLIEDLRASRRRLVAAQDGERRRIERNIHDGAQQQLVALAVKTRLLGGLIGRSPERASAMAEEVGRELTQALEDLRDLARGIYPPLLADQGLAAALSAQARKAALPVAVHADGLGRYPQEAEAAVYFCVLEALQNAAKYAGATHVEVRLEAAGEELRFSVADDGTGFDPDGVTRGSGLQGMADRLSALA